MTTWPSIVAAVKHDQSCRSRQTLGASHPALAAYGLPCDCTRDARIGAGIAAVRVSDDEHSPVEDFTDPDTTEIVVCSCHEFGVGSLAAWGKHRDAAAVAAFREASKPKEEEG